VHAAIFELPEPSAETMTALALPPPTMLEFQQPVAAPDPPGSAFGAELGDLASKAGGASRRASEPCEVSCLVTYNLC